jgi:indole-3-glycerol phosphate synthase/phosphoribosylanthranilate isomerase
MSIIEEILSKRLRRITSRGHDMGTRLPARREQPLIPFGRRVPTLGTRLIDRGKSQTEKISMSDNRRVHPFLICEIKRASPSKGGIVPGVDAVEQAARYVHMGIRTVSVLTEEEYFSGSLDDLYRIKNAFPQLCVMRKDFLIDEEDIEVSFRAGADAVLLIASMHPVQKLKMLYRKVKSLGMEALVEVHDEEDFRKASELRPKYTGFNSRNLITFRTDPLKPLFLKGKVHWNTETVFESGIRTREDAQLVLSSGFSGILIGEAAMKNQRLINEIGQLVPCAHHDFWSRLLGRKRVGVPLVKICGVTREEDAHLALECGADILGFIFAPSPRRATSGLLRQLDGLEILKVGVVVHKRGDRKLLPDVKALVQDGIINAVQFHGNEDPADCYRMTYPYYKALRLGSISDIKWMESYRCPRVLIDTFVPTHKGGTGQRIPDPLVGTVKESHTLWLAGGIGPENIQEIVQKHKPELIDLSSGIESCPGVKDHRKLRKLFDVLKRV